MVKTDIISSLLSFGVSKTKALKLVNVIDVTEDIFFIEMTVLFTDKDYESGKLIGIVDDIINNINTKSVPYICFNAKNNLVKPTIEDMVHSRQFALPLINPLRHYCENVLDKLILSPCDSSNGIGLVAESPMGNKLLLNITRPGSYDNTMGNNLVLLKTINA